MPSNPLHIALDATYSVGDTLSGVGLYSHEILMGLAAAHPEVRFDFCYRPHRYLRARRAALPSNARRRLLAEPFGPRGAFIGMQGYGASAPGEALYAHFRITPERVAEAARSLL